MMTMLQVRWKIVDSLTKLWRERTSAPVIVTRQKLQAMTGVAPQVLGRVMVQSRYKVISEFEENNVDAFMEYDDNRYKTIRLDETV